ncbi:hypothetical protein FRB94_005249 [Tulasnella sp. JGI-2019a]|nr:hypothetical protein FRB94_005249 [Tulasnella sp. JGI-2019a]KAG9016215.1 hypothetical protein FRB93_011689 [Tulasnella sp. JGI-2019a]KAG9036473.1 hypothetical protein FRB95_008771 [Tulasnella sp. JGI-2019a]
MSYPSLESVEPILDTLRDLSIASGPSSSAGNAPSAPLFARLKAVNRSSNAATASRREITAEARTKINETNLGLQNLMYERRYLEKEIEKCRSFAFIYQDVPLHSLEEFNALAPGSLRGPDAADDEHQLMLNRLAFELSERERLEAKRRSLAEERDSILTETKNFQAEVDKLSDPFEAIEKLTREVQQKIHALVPPPPTVVTSQEESEAEAEATQPEDDPIPTDLPNSDNPSFSEADTPRPIESS